MGCIPGQGNASIRSDHQRLAAKWSPSISREEIPGASGRTGCSPGVVDILCSFRDGSESTRKDHVGAPSQKKPGYAHVPDNRSRKGIEAEIEGALTLHQKIDHHNGSPPENQPQDEGADGPAGKSYHREKNEKSGDRHPGPEHWKAQMQRLAPPRQHLREARSVHASPVGFGTVSFSEASRCRVSWARARRTRNM